MNRTFEARIRALAASADLPGLSLFTTLDGVESIVAFGVRSRETMEPVNSETVFEAASLSKPVAAHLALQLVDAGMLDLDRPLSDYVEPPVRDDPALARITASHVLSHITGLPNWRSREFPLRTYFPPGSRFSYSGEGFVFLQSAIEQLTGETLADLAKRRIFDPLGMPRSSFVCRADFETNSAFPHDGEARAGAKFKPGKANAAHSLHTTACDYGRFLLACLRGSLLAEPSARLWLTPRVPVPRGRAQALGETAPETEDGVAWGLGWGVEPATGAFFHWGANPGATAFAFGMPARQAAIAIFMNGLVGPKIIPELMEALIPGSRPALKWLKFWIER